YPIEAVQVIVRIALETEGHWPGTPPTPRGHSTLVQAVSAAASTLANQAHAPLIAVFTRTGASARLISKERPAATIVAYTPLERVYRKLALWWGVTPRRSELLGTTEELIAWVGANLRKEGLASKGE